jgi:hypothetical protein
MLLCKTAEQTGNWWERAGKRIATNYVFGFNFKAIYLILFELNFWINRRDLTKN